MTLAAQLLNRMLRRDGVSIVTTTVPSGWLPPHDVAQRMTGDKLDPWPDPMPPDHPLFVNTDRMEASRRLADLYEKKLIRETAIFGPERLRPPLRKPASLLGK